MKYIHLDESIKSFFSQFNIYTNFEIEQKYQKIMFENCKSYIMTFAKLI